jgi:hypothetical protein
MPHHFLTHGVPNTPQVNLTEDNCEAYFTQHVSNVTLCRCQIYSVVGSVPCSLNTKVLKAVPFSHRVGHAMIEFTKRAPL